MRYPIQKRFFILYATFFHFLLIGPGFYSDTLIHLPDGSQKTILDLCARTLYKSIYITSYDVHNSYIIPQQIKSAARGKQNPKDGSPIRKLTEDIPNTEMFKRNYHFALDRFHDGDHFEVCDKKGNWIGVANLDGSKNHTKSNAEQDKPSRSIKKITMFLIVVSLWIIRLIN